jgi:hypothetical protein
MIMRRLFAPADIASLVAIRIAFGALMVVAVARYFAHGWIDDMFLAPRVFFPYDGLEWVRPWPGWGMYAHYAVLAAAALGVMLGCWYRLSIAVFCAAFTYAHLIDKSLYLNHYYLISLVALLLLWMPLGQAGAVDAWRHPRRRRATVPVCAVWMVRFQLAVVYVFSALAKINGDWLWHGQPLRIWLAAWADTPLLGPLLGWTPTAYAMSWAGMLFDLLIVPALLWRRTRLAAYATVVLFHLLTALLFPIGMFPWLMIVLTTVFFPPDWPRRLRIRLLPAEGTSGAGRNRTLSPRWRYATVAALGVYAAVQIVLPLRFLLRDGSVLWSEDGFRFAWRVMLMEKQGRAEFHLSDPSSGGHWTIDPHTYLTPLQAGMMATQPDMIGAFGRWLASEWAQRGYDDVEVRAEVYASLNGRPHRPLIDPALDLAHLSQHRTPATIVAPLE